MDTDDGTEKSATPSDTAAGEEEDDDTAFGSSSKWIIFDFKCYWITTVDMLLFYSLRHSTNNRTDTLLQCFWI